MSRRAGAGADSGATAASPAEKRLPDGSVQPEITGFTVALHNFTGPFDLLLHLIQVRKLDVTEVALAEVTDEFIAYTRQLGERAELEETTGFLLVAATRSTSRPRASSRAATSTTRPTWSC